MLGRNTRKIPRRFIVVGTCAAIALAAGCGLVSQEQPHAMPADSAASISLPSASDMVEELTVDKKLPVYWLEDSSLGVYLYREFTTKNQTGEPIGDSISYLLNEKPANGQWYTYLKPTKDIGVSLSDKNVITLDLPAKVFSAKLDQGLSERSIQQLVFTATAAASNSGILAGDSQPTVRILVDGQPNATVFGEYNLEDSYKRIPKFMAPIWVIDPQFGTRLGSGKVVVNGRTTTFDQGTYYSLETEKKGDYVQVISERQIAASTIEADGSFKFTQQLQPGDYRITFWGIDNASKDQVGSVSSEFTVE